MLLGGCTTFFGPLVGPPSSSSAGLRSVHNSTGASSRTILTLVIIFLPDGVSEGSPSIRPKEERGA